MRGKKKFGSIILLEFHSVWTLHFGFLASDLAPVGGQHGSIALLERLVHSTFGFLARVPVNLLEEFVQRRVSFQLLVLFLRFHLEIERKLRVGDEIKG